MWVRLVVAGVLVVVSSVVIGSAGTVAEDPVMCADTEGVLHTPTAWLDASGTLIGTEGDDVLVGSLESDVIAGLGGDDIICTHHGATYNNVPDEVDGGPGDDNIGGVGNLQGGSGRDRINAVWPWSVADGGSGADYLRAILGATADGGSGDDTLVADSDGSIVEGGSGSDLVLVRGTNAEVDCGAAYDTVTLRNPAASLRRCEVVTAP